MGITTTADLNGLFNNIYERSVFVAREANLMMALVSQYRASNFYTRTFTTRPQLTIDTVAEGVDYANPETFGLTAVGVLTPSEKIGQVILTDVDVMNDPDGAITDASTELGNAMSQKMDTELTSVFKSFGTDVGPGAGQAATLASVAKGVSILRARNAMTDGPISVVLHPYHWHDIWVQLGQPVVSQAFLGDVANEALRNYFVGNWLGVRWFISSNIAVDGSDDAVSGIFTPSAVAFDGRIPPSLRPERDESLRAWELNFVGGWAVGLGKRPTFGVKYTADAAVPS